MRLLFVHDHRFVFDGNGSAFSSKLPYSAFERYLRVARSVEVIGRISKSESNSHPRSDGPGVCVNGVTSAFFGASRRVAVRQIREAILRADGVIVRLPSTLGAVAARLSEELKRPWAAEVVACPWDGYWNHGSVAGKLMAPYAAHVMRRLVVRAPFVLYVTDRFLQDRYPASLAARSVTCSNVDLGPIDSSALDTRLQRPRHSPFRLGLIGDLGTNIKGVDTALRALREVQGRGHYAILHLLGGGDTTRWQRMAERLGIAPLVMFDGTKPAGAPVRAWLDQTDLYLQPSRQEGLPRALIEAMSRACPAIGSTAGGIPELLSDDALVSPGDYRRLAHLIVHAIESPNWCVTQSRTNIARAASFAPSVLAARRSEFWGQFADHVLSHSYFSGSCPEAIQDPDRYTQSGQIT